MNKHEALVREIAEEMATEHHPQGPVTKYVMDTVYFPAARIAVKRMHEQFMQCWQLNNPYAHDLEEGEHYAIERGLIPDPAQEGQQL
ncbi:hypothetical protein [Chitinophaga pinensis]|uniref:Uncharacterized protein n=1 Tax=Chitinophaga pinensis (strain ATCC 43595 / DSM 2588 / LMG 13176 / NBRC 15968 / NCIMB 11800 / UQM 2034) TaxID=485918 RepID=A0A979GQC8_CHIPD|nr:hypothetical protein [Chitinophaga pinensis]ACU61297.1 hypothetical protein Cpin_3835 [Chitinophaga pinensis DSM 2588]